MLQGIVNRKQPNNIQHLQVSLMLNHQTNRIFYIHILVTEDSPDFGSLINKQPNQYIWHRLMI